MEAAETAVVEATEAAETVEGWKAELTAGMAVERTKEWLAGREGRVA